LKAERSDHGQRRFKAYRAPRATLCLNFPLPVEREATGTGRAYNFQNEVLEEYFGYVAGGWRQAKGKPAFDGQRLSRCFRS
jgi:hypothetical protein